MIKKQGTAWSGSFCLSHKCDIIKVMEKLLYNYHTHTSRCGHAFGMDEEYILKAIECGIKRLGFSDHVILPEPYHQDGIRGQYDIHFEDYLRSIKYLKEKYKDQIDIIIGFEAEYYPKFEKYYRDLLETKTIDYLIQGQHCFLNSEDKFEWYFSRFNTGIERVKMYVDDLIKGMKSGLFKYVCHPDTFVGTFKEWTPELEEQARRIYEAAEELNIPLEINLHGGTFHRGENLSYPCDEFWALAKDYNIQIVIGVDAHKPEEFNIDWIQKALDFAKKHHLKLNNDFRI